MDLFEQIKAGQAVTGLWLASPAQTQEGQRRERVCQFSEAAYSGQEWLDMSRCPKQIVYSCDRCLKVTDPPFFKPRSRLSNG